MHNVNIKKNLGVTDEKEGENTEVLYKKTQKFMTIETTQMF